MKKWIPVLLIFSILFLTNSVFAKKEVRFWLRNSDGTTNPVGEGGQIGITHSTYLHSQTKGDSDVETTWFTGGSNVYYSIGSDPNYWVECESFWWSGDGQSWPPAAGDILYTTVTDNYGTYNGQSRTFAITLNSSEQQDIIGEGASLPVQMNSIMAASSQEEGITLIWRTESETDCAGFYIWRSEEEEGQYMKITTALIPGSGNKSDATEYSYSDQNVQGGIVYWYKIEEISTDGNSAFYGPVSIAISISVPIEYGLSQNYPNPFNPETTFRYQLPEMSDVSIEIYSILGQKIKTWQYVSQPAGEYTVNWNGIDDLGKQVSSGIYFLQMKAGSYREMRKMTVMH